MKSGIRHLLMQQTRRLPNRERCKYFAKDELINIRIFKLDYKEIE